MKNHLLVTCLFLSVCVHAQAAITLAPLFTDNAVLQRDKAVPVWGKGEPAETITVTFSGQKKETLADSAGRWRVQLDAMPASITAASLKVAGSVSGAKEIRGILVGDVWFASGQSNMQHIVSKCMNPQEEAAAANYPQIRMFKVWFNVSETPQELLSGKASKWSVCQPNSAGSFSAVAYYFARELHKDLQVPIGIINSSWGGTQIESWMSAPTLQASPLKDNVGNWWKQFLADYEIKLGLYTKQLAAWEASGAKASDKPREPQGAVSRWTPSGLFNAMVHPFIPYGLRGFIWYQGESNTARFDEYGTLFKALITDWRKDFAQGDLPFYFVQLANFDHKQDTTGQAWAFLREAQLEALSLPNTGAAITVDIGDPKDAHYANKQEAGRRLATAALAGTYERNINASGPVFERATEEEGNLRLHFQSEKELVLKPMEPSAFDVAGVDRKFHAASATIDGKTLVVTSPDVPRPVAVRYAWRNAPPVSLFDQDGLPAPPFRSDDWMPLAPARILGVQDSGNDAGN